MGSRKETVADATTRRARRAARVLGTALLAALALAALPAGAAAGDRDESRGSASSPASAAKARDDDKSDGGRKADRRQNGPGERGAGYILPGLLADAESHPDKTYDVIIQSSEGAEAAAEAANKGSGNGKSKRKLRAIGAVAAQIDGKRLKALQGRRGVIVTPNGPLKLMAGPESEATLAGTTGAASLWAAPAAAGAPTVAIVDSGIESRADFGARLLASTVVVDSTKNATGDGNGHGTFVAGLVAGGLAGHRGISPTSSLVSVDVLDDDGRGRASDLIAACDWILANKDAYGIKVANFSLGAPSVGVADPVNKAVQKLWLAGVTVVTSSGNYGTGAEPSNVKYAPANDPFVITVGAGDMVGTADVADDLMAPWSAWGQTSDGFRKPELSAPGRYLVSTVPAGSTLPTTVPERVTEPGYMWMSGTSFAAAVVSGAAAQVLAHHPEYGPDQVKGALMLKARPLSAPGAGVGEIDAAGSAAVASAPNPNLGLRRFVVDGAFDDTAWYAVASVDPTWNAATWSESSWAESSWSESSWSESSWSESSWSESSWSESSWAESSWAEATFLP
jgi:serine protease AprX